MASSALPPVLAMALVSQMLAEWAELIHRSLSKKQVPPGLSGAGRDVGTGPQYVLDAALLFSKRSVSAVVLW